MTVLCCECSADITAMHGNRKRCPTCAETVRVTEQRRYWLNYARRRRQHAKPFPWVPA